MTLTVVSLQLKSSDSTPSTVHHNFTVLRVTRITLSLKKQLIHEKPNDVRKPIKGLKNFRNETVQEGQ